MIIAAQKEAFFQTQLMTWFEQNHRPLPWKGERNPYFIWLSEIILQQTRVAQGMPYYVKFTEHYPTVKDLADAPEDEVMKLWEGLGYYSRARNLHAAAKYIAYDLGGIFPITYQDLLKIKGVGAYTAAAIASFAYDLPHAVVDGNVYRVLSRFFGIEAPIDSLAGQKEFKQLAEKLLDTMQPARYNQAIMDFGATHCTPKLAKCATCYLSKNCVAAQEKKVDFLPVKEKKMIKKNRYFHYLIFNFEDNCWITRREQKDIWQQLYEFPMIESDSFLENTQLFDNEIFTQYFFTQVNEKSIIKTSKPFKQLLTHQTIFAQFYEIKLPEKPKNLPNNWRSVSEAEIKNFAFPKLFNWYFQDKYLSLSLF
jgi:A/G-specific adenine glycosylase